MSGYSRSLPEIMLETFREILGVSSSGSREEILFSLILECQRGQKAVSDTTISFLGGLILTRGIYHCSGPKSIIRLWLIFGEFVVVVELPAILLTTWLNRLLVGIATLGRGSGVVLLKAGRFLKGFLGKWVGRIVGS